VIGCAELEFHILYFEPLLLEGARKREAKRGCKMLWELYVSIKTMIERPRMWPNLEALKGWLASNCLRR